LKEEDEDADTEDEEDYTDSEMEELADEVEQKIVVEAAETLPPPDPVVVQPQFLDAFDRGLAKRQSKGKYQHSRVDMYGRGVSMECESPTLPRKPLGGPQPTNDQSPFLFDKVCQRQRPFLGFSSSLLTFHSSDRLPFNPFSRHHTRQNSAPTNAFPALAKLCPFRPKRSSCSILDTRTFRK
uniref:DNA-directed RNA polymerase n=1 Tax=Heligmosomoides polygyrus TaxID=6339 RepID=A0A183FMS3_HELPZ